MRLVVAAWRQALTLGHGLAGFANYFYVARWDLWLAMLPHATPELTAIFLPVAASLCASRAGAQRGPRSLTAAAMLAALPLLATAAILEVYVAPKTFRALTCIGESEGFRAGGNCATEPRECPKLTFDEFEQRYGIHLSPADRADTRRRCR